MEVLLNKGFVLGRFIITTVMQDEGAPIIDSALTTTKEGKRFNSIAICLTPWKRNKYGERMMQRALILGKTAK